METIIGVDGDKVVSTTTDPNGKTVTNELTPVDGVITIDKPLISGEANMIIEETKSGPNESELVSPKTVSDQDDAPNEVNWKELPMMNRIIMRYRKYRQAYKNATSPEDYPEDTKCDDCHCCG